MDNQPPDKEKRAINTSKKIFPVGGAPTSDLSAKQNPGGFNRPNLPPGASTSFNPNLPPGVKKFAAPPGVSPVPAGTPSAFKAYAPPSVSAPAGLPFHAPTPPGISPVAPTYTPTSGNVSKTSFPATTKPANPVPVKPLGYAPVNAAPGIKPANPAGAPVKPMSPANVPSYKPASSPLVKSPGANVGAGSKQQMGNMDFEEFRKSKLKSATAPGSNVKAVLAKPQKDRYNKIEGMVGSGENYHDDMVGGGVPVTEAFFDDNEVNPYHDQLLSAGPRKDIPNAEQSGYTYKDQLIGSGFAEENRPEATGSQYQDHRYGSGVPKTEAHVKSQKIQKF